MSDDIERAFCPVCQATSRYDFSSRDLMFDHYTRYDYFACTVCQAVFLHPMPSQEQINDFYPSDYSIFDEKTQVRKLSLLKQAILYNSYGYKHLDIPPAYQLLAKLISPLFSFNRPHFVGGGKLLDVGCGNGRYLTTMRSLGWDVEGVEMSEDGLKVCHDAGLNVHHGDLLSAQLPSDYFDVITVRHVIEHISDPHSFTIELTRILKPSGRLIIETPNSNALGRARLGPKWYANEVPRHLILYSPENLIQLLKGSGVTDSKLSLDSTPKIFLNSLDYVFDNTGKRSKKVRWKRWLARLYLWAARYTQRGDVIHAVFTKE